MDALSDAPSNCETQASETPAKGGHRRCKVRAGFCRCMACLIVLMISRIFCWVLTCSICMAGAIVCSPYFLVCPR